MKRTEPLLNLQLNLNIKVIKLTGFKINKTIKNAHTCNINSSLTFFPYTCLLSAFGLDAPLNHRWASQMTFLCRSAAEATSINLQQHQSWRKTSCDERRCGRTEKRFSLNSCSLHQSKTNSQLHSWVSIATAGGRRLTKPASPEEELGGAPSLGAIFHRHPSAGWLWLLALCRDVWRAATVAVGGLSSFDVQIQQLHLQANTKRGPSQSWCSGSITPDRNTHTSHLTE